MAVVKQMSDGLRKIIAYVVVIGAIMVAAVLSAVCHGGEIPVYTWAQVENAPANFVQIIYANGQGDPAKEGVRVGKILTRLPVDQRALQIWNPCHDLAPDNLRDYVANGLDVQRYREWYDSFFKALRAQRVKTIALLTSDFERGADAFRYGFGSGTLPVYQVWSDPKLRAKLPLELATWPIPNEPLLNNKHRQFYIVWNAREAREVRGTYWNLVTVGKNRPTFKLINDQGEWATGARGMDMNNWPTEGTCPFAGSPESYLHPTTVNSPWYKCVKDGRWNSIIHALNGARFQVATGKPFIPVISVPNSLEGGGNLEVWKILVSQLAALNPDAIVLWNPHGWIGWPEQMFSRAEFVQPLDEAAKFLGELQRPTAAPDTVQIPFDSDEIRTGEFVTTYAEFVLAAQQ